MPPSWGAPRAPRPFLTPGPLSRPPPPSAGGQPSPTAPCVQVEDVLPPPPALAGGHSGDFRSVQMRPIPRRWPGGLHIAKFCGRSDFPGEGQPCTHPGRVKRVDHWSCCGRGALEPCAPSDADAAQEDPARGFLAEKMPRELGQMLAPLARMSMEDRLEAVADISQGTGVEIGALMAAIDIAAAKFG